MFISNLNDLKKAMFRWEFHSSHQSVLTIILRQIVFINTVDDSILFDKL